MAFTLSAEGQAVFFQKVFGSTHPVTEKVKALVTSGVTFEVLLYTIKAKQPGKSKPAQVSTTYGTTSLMKGTVDLVMANQNKKLIGDWVTSLWVAAGLGKEEEPVVVAAPVPAYWAPVVQATSTMVVLEHSPLVLNTLPLIKAVQTVTGLGLMEAKTVAEAAMKGTPQNLKAFSTVAAAEEAVTVLEAAGGKAKMATEVLGPPPTPAQVAVPVAKPVDAVIALKDAKALGQKVHGTSQGSVYHCIALAEHVKVAARIMKGGAISLRAEWTDNPTDDLKKLSEAGVHMKPSYGSIHFDAAEVPLQRVIGAFLVGTSIKWKASITNGADLVIS